MIGNRSFPLSEIVDASAERRRLFFFFPRYFLIIATRRGERTVLCHRNGYLVFQLLKALEMALRETNRVVRSSTQPVPEGHPPASLSLLDALGCLIFGVR
jgi:hypothetical protein